MKEYQRCVWKMLWSIKQYYQSYSVLCATIAECRELKSNLLPQCVTLANPINKKGNILRKVRETNLKYSLIDAMSTIEKDGFRQSLHKVVKCEQYTCTDYMIECTDYLNHMIEMAVPKHHCSRKLVFLIQISTLHLLVYNTQNWNARTGMKQTVITKQLWHEVKQRNF